MNFFLSEIVNLIEPKLAWIFKLRQNKEIKLYLHNVLVQFFISMAICLLKPELNIGYTALQMSPKRTIQVLVVWMKNSVRT